MGCNIDMAFQSGIQSLLGLSLQNPSSFCNKGQSLTPKSDFFFYCSFCTIIFQRCFTCVHQGSMDPPYIPSAIASVIQPGGQVSSQCSLDLLLSLPFAPVPLEIVRFLRCPTTNLENQRILIAPYPLQYLVFLRHYCPKFKMSH